jgi:hypothetical protein
MSRGPGAIEARIGNLFAANQDRALLAEEVARHAFDLGDRSPTRSQRLSVIRAAHRVIRRCQEMHEKSSALRDRARARLGPQPEDGAEFHEYWRKFKRDPAWRKAERLNEAVERIGSKSRYRREGQRIFLVNTDYWRATTLGKGRSAKLWFHAPDVPVQVWAVTIDRSGVHWFDAEVVYVTKRNVMALRRRRRPP